MIVSKKFTNPLAKAHTKELTFFFDEESDDAVAGTFKAGQVWATDLASVSSLFWNEQSTILDIGASIGAYSTLAASFTHGKVISIEPEPKNYMTLTMTQEANKFSHQVCYNLAASNEEGEIKFCPNGPYSHILQEGGAEDAISVPSKTLDSVLDGERVDFIKLDVEGWEIPALEGLEKTINRYSPPIVFEVNGFTLKWFNKTPNDLIRILEERFGYQIFALTQNLVPLSSFDPFPYGCVDCFALKASHIPKVSQYLSLPLSFGARKQIFEQTETYGNEDIKGYVEWYKERMPQ